MNLIYKLTLKALELEYQWLKFEYFECGCVSNNIMEWIVVVSIANEMSKSDHKCHSYDIIRMKCVFDQKQISMNQICKMMEEKMEYWYSIFNSIF
jgi:hypothetical protein